MGITERIYHELKRRLENGVYLSGSRFPSETSLADEFSVNKMTMNKVVSLLVGQKYQIREAIDRNVPVAFPLGVVEYHAEHLPLGVDCFTVINIIERVEKRRPELVVLPP